VQLVASISFCPKTSIPFVGEQLVVFSDRKDLFSITNEPEAQKTMLTMWLKANRKYPQAR